MLRHKQQPGRIIGRITDMATGEPLPNATVQLQGSSSVTVTDNRGLYRLNGVPAGRAELVVRYLGYVDQQVSVNVEAGRAIQADIAMTPQLTELEGIAVSGICRGEVKSLNTMKNAENIKYVLSQEQIERFPDNTVGEALQRVPGVAVGYSYGLARNVTHRYAITTATVGRITIGFIPYGVMWGYGIAHFEYSMTR